MLAEMPRSCAGPLGRARAVLRIDRGIPDTLLHPSGPGPVYRVRGPSRPHHPFPRAGIRLGGNDTLRVAAAARHGYAFPRLCEDPGFGFSRLYRKMGASRVRSRPVRPGADRLGTVDLEPA